MRTELLEYSVTSVTEGIDALATTRVSIRGASAAAASPAAAIHAQSGEAVQRSFRCKRAFGFFLGFLALF